MAIKIGRENKKRMKWNDNNDNINLLDSSWRCVWKGKQAVFEIILHSQFNFYSVLREQILGRWDLLNILSDSLYE